MVISDYITPVMYLDPSGYFWETFFDVGFAVWSFIDLIKDPSLKNLGWFGLDLLCIAIPFVLGGSGKLSKAITKIDNIDDFSMIASKGSDIFVIGQNMKDCVKPVAKILGANIYDGWKYYNKYDNMGKIGHQVAKWGGYIDNMAYLARKSFAGYRFVDTGYDIGRVGVKAYNFGRFTLQSERFIVSASRFKNVARIFREIYL
ncbi:hypothetical protein RJI07_05195 [Mycoplasmatota bacterium WC30]